MAIEAAELQRLQQDAEKLETSFKTLLLSTLNDAQQPALSYSPYVRQGNDYYVFISELAEHTQHLLARPECSIMFVKDEADSRNLFARERLILQCRATVMDKASVQGQQVLDQMQATLGETVALLRQLGDFRLFCLSPEQGRYVVGFGKAFLVNGETRELSHIDADKLQGKP